MVKLILQYVTLTCTWAENSWKGQELRIIHLSSAQNGSRFPLQWSVRSTSFTSVHTSSLPHCGHYLFSYSSRIYSLEPTDHFMFLPQVTPRFCFAHIFLYTLYHSLPKPNIYLKNLTFKFQPFKIQLYCCPIQEKSL